MSHSIGNQIFCDNDEEGDGKALKRHQIQITSSLTVVTRQYGAITAEGSAFGSQDRAQGSQSLRGRRHHSVFSPRVKSDERYLKTSVRSQYPRDVEISLQRRKLRFWRMVRKNARLQLISKIEKSTLDFFVSSSGTQSVGELTELSLSPLEL